MYTGKRLTHSSNVFRLLLFSTLLVFCITCVYMKMDPPPDVDKGPPAPTAPCIPDGSIVANTY
jgi:hypothetical protein